MKHTIEYKLNSIERLSDNRYARVADLSGESILKVIENGKSVCGLCIHKHEICFNKNTCHSFYRKDKKEIIFKQIF